MKFFLISRASLILLLLLFVPVLLFARKGYGATRNINIAGLVVDSKTLLPVEAANIYGEDKQLLGKTDAKGYFKIIIAYQAVGKMKFKININKNGYKSITQNEHWGNLPNNTNALMYFGLDKTGEGDSSFSKLINNAGSDLSYANVLKNFETVKAAKSFDSKLASAKAGNQNVLIKIDDKFYIVNKTGWIAINSDKDSILINKQQLVIADKLNSVVKRKDVKWMTPLNAKNTKLAVYTK